jgi:hypothetical protein
MLLTDNLTAGMVLSANVYARTGRLLLGAGTELTDKHIYIFRIWGVVEVDISGWDEEGGNPTTDNLIDMESWSNAEAAIRPLFCHADLTHPGMQELLRLGILRRAQHGNR